MNFDFIPHKCPACLKNIAYGTHFCDTCNATFTKLGTEGK